jgi:hypothetical protein
VGRRHWGGKGVTFFDCDWEDNGTPATGGSPSVPASGGIATIDATVDDEGGPTNAAINFDHGWFERNSGFGITTSGSPELSLRLADVNVGPGRTPVFVTATGIVQVILENTVCTDAIVLVGCAKSIIVGCSLPNVSDNSITRIVSASNVNGSVFGMSLRGDIQLSGNLRLVTESGSGKIVSGSFFRRGDRIAGFNNGDLTGAEHAFFQVNGVSGNPNMVCGLSVAADPTTGRSINMGGSIASGGSDIAEYEVLADGQSRFEKGDIVGFDVEGKLTHVFDDAYSFGVKSTSPWAVGGDSWPVDPSSSDELHENDNARSSEQLRLAQAQVERVAYCGKVPVNVYGAKPGQWIVASRDEAGNIAPAISLTDTEYVVGRVRRILPDGRAYIVVKTG